MRTLLRRTSVKSNKRGNRGPNALAEQANQALDRCGALLDQEITEAQSLRFELGGECTQKASHLGNAALFDRIALLSANVDEVLSRKTRAPLSDGDGA